MTGPDTASEAVKYFLKKYRPARIDVRTLQAALEQQGYTVIRFSRLANDPNLTALIRALQVEPYIASTRGFTYASADFRLVFLHADLSAEEAAMVLAHEQGHILCGHTATQAIVGQDVQQEHEANEFAHMLLHPPLPVRARLFVRRRKKLCLWLCAGLAALAVAGGVLAVVARNNTYYGEYYLTETGAKYHTAQCGYVRDKTNIRRMTKEDYASGKYAPCEKCTSDENAP